MGANSCMMFTGTKHDFCKMNRKPCGLGENMENPFEIEKLQTYPLHYHRCIINILNDWKQTILILRERRRRDTLAVFFVDHTLEEISSQKKIKEVIKDHTA